MFPAAGPSPVFPYGTYSLNNVCDGYMMTYPLFVNQNFPTTTGSPGDKQMGQATVFKVTCFTASLGMEDGARLCMPAGQKCCVLGAWRSGWGRGDGGDRGAVWDRGRGDGLSLHLSCVHSVHRHTEIYMGMSLKATEDGTTTHMPSAVPVVCLTNRLHVGWSTDLQVQV